MSQLTISDILAISFGVMTVLEAVITILLAYLQLHRTPRNRGEDIGK